MQRFNSSSFCPSSLNLCCLLFGQMAQLWFLRLRRRRVCGSVQNVASWPWVSCMNFVSFRFPSGKLNPTALAHPPSCAVRFLEESCLTSAELLPGWAGIWGDEKDCTPKLWRLFSAIELDFAEMLYFVYGECWCRDAAIRSVYGL